MTDVKPELQQGDTLPVRAGSGPFTYSLGHVEVTKQNGPIISAKYHYDAGDELKSVHCKDHDLSKGELTIGTDPASSLVLPARDSLSQRQARKHDGLSQTQAIIRQRPDGGAEYEHRGEQPIVNPEYRFARPEMSGPIKAKSGRAAGYTVENRTTNNTRTENEDRGFAMRTQPLSDKKADEFLVELIKDHLTPATIDMKGGSTVSLAMNTTDGHLACAYLGDSPIYLIAKNNKTGNIAMTPMGIPHNGFGLRLRKALANCMFMPPDTHNYYAQWQHANDFDTDIEALSKDDKERTKLRGIYKCLGRMEQSAGRDHEPEHFIVKPAKECPEGFTYLGALVCSDGIDSGILAGASQKAVHQLLKQNPKAKSEQIAKAAVEAAVPYTSDNVSAIMLPANAPAGTTAVIADGNCNTSAVAQKAVEVLEQELTRTAMVPLVVKKKGEYRVSLQGSLAMGDEGKKYLEMLVQQMREHSPEHSAQMGTHIVRDTLIVRNPGTKIKNFLDNFIQEQEKSENRGRL